MQSGVVLVNSSALGTFTGSSVPWQGGRAALVIEAAQFGASVQLQVLHISGNWIPLNAATITASGVVEYPVPAGSVRMFSSGSSAGMTASLIEIPYQ